MKIKYWAIFFNLLLVTCEPEIENNKRVLIEGKIVTPTGEPISDISVTSFIENQKLGEDFTNSNGEFSFASFESFDGDYKIKINSYTSDYSSAIIQRAYVDTPQKEIYQLGQIELKPLSFLNLKITKTSSEDHQLYWRLQYFIPQCRYTFDFVSLEPNSLYCFEERSYDFTQNAAEPDFSKRFKTLKDVSVKFFYKIDDGNTQTIEIPMNEKTVDYEFNY